MAVFLHTHKYTQGFQYSCVTSAGSISIHVDLNEIKWNWNNITTAHIGGMEISVNVGFVLAASSIAHSRTGSNSNDTTLHYWSTWPRVSGSLRAKKLPTAKAPDAKRMGTALVMPTNDWKMLMPRTAANLQRAFRKPKAVVLWKRRKRLNMSWIGSTSWLYIYIITPVFSVTWSFRNHSALYKK